VRFGVSAKIFLAYTVLLIAFAGSTSFTVVTIHRARQGVVANEAYLDLQSSVEGAWRSLNDFAGALGRNLRREPNLALAFRTARKNLDDALAVIDRYQMREPNSSHRAGFEADRRQVEAFKASLDGLATQLGSARAGAEAFKASLDGLATQLGSARAGADDVAYPEFDSQFANLTRGLNRMRRPLRGESAQIAQRLADDGDNALQVALAVGALGLVLAVGAVFLMWQTLRPLHVLRARARQIAGGDYGQRTGVSSHDEIGDLARELDAMAGAVEEREHRLIRSERLATVGRMAAQVTHEVRNPLASIGLYAELLGDEAGASDEARRLVESISSEVDRLTEITENYLRFAKLPQPKLEHEDLSALVASVAEFARAELAQSRIALEMDLPPRPVDIAVDENQIRQALLNLIRNAREAMADGGRLKISVERREDDSVAITVTDSGAGISTDNLEKVFDPFFSTKAKGTGLGLALVHQIAAEHGGRAEVESLLGQGTTFRLVLPARTSAGGVRADEAGGEAAASGGSLVLGSRERSPALPSAVVAGGPANPGRLPV